MQRKSLGARWSIASVRPSRLSVDAAVPGRLAVGPRAAGARLCRAGRARDRCGQAWVVDDTGVVKDGKHSPGVKRQYSGTLGKIGNCQITVSVHAVGGRGTVPLGWRLYLPEDWCDDQERRRKAKIPESVCFQDQAAARGLGSGQAGERSGLIPQGAGARRCGLWRRRRVSGAVSWRPGSSTCCRSSRRRQRIRASEPASRFPSGRARGGRLPYTRPGPDRELAESVRCSRARAASLRRGRRFPVAPHPGRRIEISSRFLRSSAWSQRTQSNAIEPPRSGRVADRRMARRRAEPYRLLALQPPRRNRERRTARPPRQAALDDRARLPASSRASSGSTITKAEATCRLPPPHRPGHLRSRLSHPGAARPKSPAAGLTLPQAVQLLMQPPFMRCWDWPLPNLPPVREPRQAVPTLKTLYTTSDKTVVKHY